MERLCCLGNSYVDDMSASNDNIHSTTTCFTSVLKRLRFGVSLVCIF